MTNVSNDCNICKPLCQCVLFDVAPFPILTQTLNFFDITSISNMDRALTSKNLRDSWLSALKDLNAEAFNKFSMAYVKFGMLKWISARKLILPESFKLKLPSHHGQIQKEWGTYPNYGPSMITAVASSGSVDVMRLLLATKGSHSQIVDDVDGCGYTSLMVACSKNDAPMVELLLQHGANPNYQCFSNDRCALHLACVNESWPVVKLLLDAGVPGTRAKLTTQDRRGRNVLFFAAKWGDTKVLKMMLAREDTKEALNQKDYANGESALAYCARKNLPEPAALLLDAHGCDPNIYSRNGQTPLHTALALQHFDVVSALLAHQSIDCTLLNQLGESASTLAATVLITLRLHIAGKSQSAPAVIGSQSHREETYARMLEAVATGVA